MKTLLSCCLMLLLLVACGCGNGERGQVYQGVCVRMDAATKTLELSNTEPELNPIPGGTALFDLSRASVGLLPEPGDEIRVAFTSDGSTLVAHKVMNVSKQSLREK
ncbi:MAG: hypothetical protein HY812_03410 [Planctomycetes bacterium]|nr:hypothetical protein [Planctomycetota bacterium]